MLVALNVATPFAAIWGPAPLNVPPPALVPKPSMIPGLPAVTRLVNWSPTSTRLAGVMAAPTAPFFGPPRNGGVRAAAGRAPPGARGGRGRPAPRARPTLRSEL